MPVAVFDNHMCYLEAMIARRPKAAAICVEPGKKYIVDPVIENSFHFMYGKMVVCC